MSEAVIIGALIAGYPVLCGAIAKLYRDLRKSQDARMEGEKEYVKMLEHMLKIANGAGTPNDGGETA